MSVVLAVLGLVLGSFAGAMVWRLRARQLREDEAAGEKISKAEQKQVDKLKSASVKTDRSICLHCGHRLAWYDLVPLLSWVQTSGKCRYCARPIGYFEPLIELGMAVLLVGSYVLWPFALDSPLEIARLVVWLVACVPLVILFAYDLKWYILPNRVVFPLIGLSSVSVLCVLGLAADIPQTLLSIVGAILILPGLYLVLWLVSKGKWVGFGDIKLSVALALFVTDYRLAFVALFAANLIGCLLIIPGLIAGTIKRQTHVPFGPMLIGGTVVALLFGQHIIEWYQATFIL